MKRQTIINGYICTATERALRKYLVPTGFIVMLFFAYSFWAEAVRHNDSIAHWLCATGWTAYVAYLIILSHSCNIINDMRFCVEPGKVTNICSLNNCVVLDLSKQLFITKITRELGYGKATKKRSFYLFSSKSLMLDYVQGTGLSVLKRLNKNGVVIIPQDEEVDKWLALDIGVPNVPSYPRVAFKQGQRDSSLS